MNLRFARSAQAACFLVFAAGLGAQTQPPPVVPARTLSASTLESRTKWWVQNSLGANAFVGSAIGATARMVSPANGYPREWRQGAEGYGRNFGHYFAMNATAYTAKLGVAALLGEDPRYHPSTEKGAAKRIKHAIIFSFVDRSNSGHLRPAISTWAGALAGGFVTKAYLPNRFNDSVHAGQWTLINFGALVGDNFRDEFRPEFRRLAKKLHLPFPRP